jgi:hypothetical protein
MRITETNKTIKSCDRNYLLQEIKLAHVRPGEEKYIYQILNYISDEENVTRIFTGHHTGYFVMSLFLYEKRKIQNFQNFLI